MAVKVHIKEITMHGQEVARTSLVTSHGHPDFPVCPGLTQRWGSRSIGFFRLSKGSFEGLQAIFLLDGRPYPAGTAPIGTGNLISITSLGETTAVDIRLGGLLAKKLRRKYKRGSNSDWARPTPSDTCGFFVTNVSYR